MRTETTRNLSGGGVEIEEPKVAPIILLGIPAIILAAAWQYSTAPFLQLVTGAGAILFGCSAAAYLLYDVLVIMLDSYDRFQRSHAITPILLVAEAVKHLNADQLAMIPRFDYAMEVGWTYGKESWQLYVITPSGNVPFDFAKEWLERSSVNHVWPERSTAEGSDRRRWYVMLLQWAVYHGWAEPPIPGRPTRWVGDARRDIALSLDITLTELEPSVVVASRN